MVLCFGGCRKIFGRLLSSVVPLFIWWSWGPPGEHEVSPSTRQHPSDFGTCLSLRIDYIDANDKLEDCQKMQMITFLHFVSTKDAKSGQ